MEHFIALLINIVASTYFMGEKLAQHEKAQELIAETEAGFSELVHRLKNKQPVAILDFLLNLSAIVTLASFIGIILLGTFKIHSPKLVEVLATTFLFSGLVAGSLFWVKEHGKVAVWIIKVFFFFAIGSLSMPLMDLLTGSNITHTVYTMMQTSFGSLFELPFSKGLFFEGMVVSGMYMGFVIFFYIVGWIYSTPIILVAWLLVSLPVFMARYTDKLFPRNPIVVLFFILWLLSLLYLTYA